MKKEYTKPSITVVDISTTEEIMTPSGLTAASLLKGKFTAVTFGEIDF